MNKFNINQIFVTPKSYSRFSHFAKLSLEEVRMKNRKNILGVPNTDGMYIGKVIDVYIELKKGKIAGVLCQLLGHPAKLLFYQIGKSLAEVESGKFIIGPHNLPSWGTPRYFDIHQDISHLLRLRGIELYNENKDFLGFLDDFTFNAEQLSLDNIFTTGGEQIILDDDRYFIDQFEGKKQLVVHPKAITPIHIKAKGIFSMGVVLKEYSRIPEDADHEYEPDSLNDKWKQRVVSLELTHI